MVATELMVRMGELEASRSAGDVLVSIGLGSCIGLALVDRQNCVAGLAHVMLPTASASAGDAPGKFAGTAVPALVGRMRELGSTEQNLEAVLVGGAQMFSFGGGPGRLDVGARNDEATRAALAAAQIPVVAAETGGGAGRTVRVIVDGAYVTVKEAGGSERTIHPDAAAS